MNTPEQLASLEGQQYLVLRPTAAVARAYELTQAPLLARAPLPHPHTGHITLRGFYEPERRAELANLVREWAAAQPPVEAVVEAVDAFPAPWQIVILRLARTPSLLRAYASLTAALEGTDLRRLGELSLDDWTFHLSVLYAKTLDADGWGLLESGVREEFETPPAETITEAELVWYEGRAEHAEVIPLRG